MTEGRSLIRAALLQHLTPEHTPVPFTLTDLFDTELGEYTEVIAGPGVNPIGFMTHGEGLLFTERVRIALEQLELSAADLERHQAMAGWFEHARGFFKAEWHRTDRGVEPLAAIYFRRRPVIGEVTDHLESWGLPVTTRDRVTELANLLDKQSIHFVSAAFRPDHPIHHKMYFSQWVTADSRAEVAARIASVFDLFGFDAVTRDDMLARHERSLGPDDCTMFVSTSISEAGVSPTFKIDYPDIQPEVAAQWVPAEQRAAVTADARRCMSLAGTRQLTYLGLRFASDQASPSLKYYSDVPGSR